MVVMVGIGCVTPAFWFKHEVVLVDYFIESVTPRHDVRENVFEYDKHLVRTDAGGFTAYLTDLFHYLFFCQFKLVSLFFANRVITFTSLAKQSAQTADTYICMPEPKVIYCLAPAFFSKSIPYCSLPILSTSFRASFRSSEYSRALRKREISSRSLSSSLI